MPLLNGTESTLLPNHAGNLSLVTLKIHDTQKTKIQFNIRYLKEFCKKYKVLTIKNTLLILKSG